MRRLVPLLVLALAVSTAGCGDNKARRAQEQLEALKKKQEAEAKARAEKSNKPLATEPKEQVKLDPPYDERQAVVIVPDGKCPEGFWALFPGEAPGTTPEEKKANAAKRKELADQLRSQKYLVKLRGGQQVTLSAYDAPKGQFTIDVLGTVDCTDSFGHIAIAWTDAKAGDPGNSAAKDGAEVTQNVWIAPPVPFTLGIKSMTEAKTFSDQNRFGLSARVGFTLGKVQVDKKLKKVAKVTENVAAAGESISIGGGVEDWGAGRLVQVDLLGIRVATDQEKKQLFEKTGK
jgi:hypothetical protein